MAKSLDSTPAKANGVPRARVGVVAVVGAGAAGLVAARELLREGHAVTVFERSDRVGGTWAYDPRPDGPDPLASGNAVHGGSSMYASLRTNLPRELMGFSGHESLAGRVFAGDPRAFPGHRKVLAFLRAFADDSGVTRHVRFRTEVVRVAPPLRRSGEKEERWSVAWRGESGEVAVEAFDAVVVCNGHCTVPLVPKLRGIDKWRGKQMHSHNYRIPEPFRDQIVVVVGLGASGIDIAREISQVAKEVHIASRENEHRLGKIDLYPNVWMHAEVDCIQDNGQVRFTEGAAVTADMILYCTGYRYHFPFLDLEELTVDEDNCVGPLYKHVFPPKYAPSLSFVGLPAKTIIFQSFELESKWVARVLSGRVALPSEEGMLAAVREHYRRMEESGKPRRHTHVLMPEWMEYMDWLAEQVGEPRLEARRREMYERALECIWSLDGGYRDKGDADTASKEYNHGGGRRLHSDLDSGPFDLGFLTILAVHSLEIPIGRRFSTRLDIAPSRCGWSQVISGPTCHRVWWVVPVCAAKRGGRGRYSDGAALGKIVFLHGWYISCARG